MRVCRALLLRPAAPVDPLRELLDLVAARCTRTATQISLLSLAVFLVCWRRFSLHKCSWGFFYVIEFTCHACFLGYEPAEYWLHLKSCPQNLQGLLCLSILFVS